ncbi:MAG TPA: hypothetical protein VJR47_02760 [Stellaceae bacterium]|nr:hypothetical protein [Stellaceae bacterium]
MNDLHRCESDTQQIAQLGTSSREPIDAGRYFASCMNAHGWHLERQLLPVARHGADSFGSY